MAIVRMEDYFSMSELEDVEPYVEIRDPNIVPALGAYEATLGENVVPAGEYLQGVSGADAVLVDTNYDFEQVPQADQVVNIPREYTTPRVIDDLEDPYNSPMLEGFLQIDFEPTPVVAYYDKKGNPVFAE
jgi:hypothetical protein